MNLFLFDDDTVPLPPITTSQAVQRVLSVFDALSRGLGPAPLVRLRCREDVLVEAKVVDERVRSGERLPLVGTLVAAPDHPAVVGRLARAGAVVAGHTVPGTPSPGSEARLETLSKLDALLVTEPPAGCRGVVGFVPTRGLLPTSDCGVTTVLARDASVAQQVAAAITGPDSRSGPRGFSRYWPDSVRLSAGQHPRIAVPDADFLAGLPVVEAARLRATATTLRVAGASTTEVALSASGSGPDVCRRRAAHALQHHDAVLLPLGTGACSLSRLVTRLDTAAMLVPLRHESGIGLLAKPFDDQVVLDLAGLLTGSQASGPYPDVGVRLVAFGSFLRGQPRAVELERVGARFTGFATTTRQYRLVLLEDGPPEAGVVPASGPTDGGPLLGEEWLLAPAALGEFVAHLPAPMRLGTVELADGTSSLAVLCDPAAADGGLDLTRWECWRAYLRHLSAVRPAAARAGS
ncbi:amidase [Saccharomonospora sp. NB11]|uniref:allophanate hydrolase-related protein n=1 Tax=Saccharomonospora sp. NB11 TaxID=1642298 RepID=UPI0018D049CD|nr:amidase [Saccharomonospora sp. NB11]